MPTITDGLVDIVRTWLRYSWQRMLSIHDWICLLIHKEHHQGLSKWPCVSIGPICYDVFIQTVEQCTSWRNRNVHERFVTNHGLCVVMLEVDLLNWDYWKWFQYKSLQRTRHISDWTEHSGPCFDLFARHYQFEEWELSRTGFYGMLCLPHNEFCTTKDFSSIMHVVDKSKSSACLLRENHSIPSIHHVSLSLPQPLEE